MDGTLQPLGGKPTLQLRPYQAEAVNAIYGHFKVHPGGGVVDLPTGGGKSIVIARIAADCTAWGLRTIVVAHRRELLEQTAAKVEALAPDLDYGVYCAGLDRRETDRQVSFASIQSAYAKAADFGHVDVVLVDEAHLVPNAGEGQYRQFIAGLTAINPGVKLAGLTATPFRTDSGPLCIEGGIFSRVAYSISTSELIDDGFLCRLTTKAAAESVDTARLRRRAGEFVQADVDALVGGDEMVRAACGEVVAKTEDRRHVLVFSAGVDHGQHVAETLQKFGCDVAFVCGETPRAERDHIRNRFVSGDLKYLVNCDLFTTGFDSPNVDCVATLRPTDSTVLWVQMVGRGLRLHPDKADCLILDFGQNAERLGPIDDPIVRRPDDKVKRENAGKVCPECVTVVASGVRACPDCGYEFEPRERSHEVTAGTAAILSSQDGRTRHRVVGVEYEVHEKRSALPTTPKSLRVTYRLSDHDSVSEWICLEHPECRGRQGFARKKAVRWWRERSDEPPPFSAAEAVWIAENGGLAEPTEITIKPTPDKPWPTIVRMKLGRIPAGAVQ